MNMFSLNHISLIDFPKLSNWSVQYLLDDDFGYSNRYSLKKIGTFLKRNKTPIDIEDNKYYKRVTIKTNNGGVFLRDIQIGSKIGTKKQFIITKEQFILSKIDARNGAFGVANQEVDGAIITGNFWAFDVDTSIINPYFLSLITTTTAFIRFCEQASNGTTNRHYLQEKLFLEQQIPLPSLAEQNEIVQKYNKKIKIAREIDENINIKEKKIEEYLFEELGIIVEKKKKILKELSFVSFKNIIKWGIDSHVNILDNYNVKYEFVSLYVNNSLFFEIFRGKSPKYTANSNKVILNQKCIRWNSIELQHAKTVDESWWNSIKENVFTKVGDILINSTGEGTIGRSVCIKNDFVNCLYDSHVLLLRLNPEVINPEFFTLLFNSSFGQNQVNQLKSAQSTKQTELGIGNLKKIRIPLPPMVKQNLIVEYLNTQLLEIEELRREAAYYHKQAILEFEKLIFES